MFKNKTKSRPRQENDDYEYHHRPSNSKQAPGVGGRFWRPAPYGAVIAASQFLDGGSMEQHLTTARKTSPPSSTSRAVVEGLHGPVGYGSELVYVDDNGMVWRDMEEKQEYAHLLSTDPLSPRSARSGWTHFHDVSTDSLSNEGGLTIESSDDLGAYGGRVGFGMEGIEYQSVIGMPAPQPHMQRKKPRAPGPLALPLPHPRRPSAPSTHHPLPVTLSTPTRSRPPPLALTPQVRNTAREAREEFIKSSFNPQPVLATFQQPSALPLPSPGRSSTIPPVSSTSAISKLKNAGRRLSSSAVGFPSISKSNPASPTSSKPPSTFLRRGFVGSSSESIAADKDSKAPGPPAHRSLFAIGKSKSPPTTKPPTKIRSTTPNGEQPIRRKRSSGSIRDVFKKASFF